MSENIGSGPEGVNDSVGLAIVRPQAGTRDPFAFVSREFCFSFVYLTGLIALVT